MYSFIQNPRFMLVGLVSPILDKEKMVANFEELESLVLTYGGKVYAATTQNSTRADNATYIGTGKAQEVADTVLTEKIDIVVINATIKSGQIYTLKKIFERSNPDIVVWDRTDLILNIFSKHAKTAEAKLQIKLAMMRHMGPRIYGMGMELSKQAGGIGTRGSGETNTEIMRRHFRYEIRNVHKELDKITKTKERQITQRKSHGSPTVSIIGYTNAGKSSLFNNLTGGKNLVDNTLFVTLSSNVSKLYLPKIKKEVYLTDTIGFIQNLPHQLIEAFKSTLMETTQADLLLQVIDLSDPWIHDKIKVVEGILRELKVDTKRQLYVFNKMDKAKDLNQDDLSNWYSTYNPQFICAKSGKGCDKLIEVISENID
ncbi:GTPase HflX [Candidatus Gottesmanbacteria bacterium]|nr:GTPase HflX [Candidatus Gottesmanbacteria bacterium]